MKTMTISVSPQLKQVEVILNPGLLFSETSIQQLKPIANRFALFCDETVAHLYGNQWLSYLKKGGLDVILFTFPKGEQEKSRETKIELEDLLFAQKFGSDMGMIALGGGVTTDLIGFLASTYCRGISLVFVPTTLLAMVDAAIGGKTGVNTPFGKNLIGTYYSADTILIDTSLLSSLPKSEWINGLAEVIKYGLIHSPHLLEILETWNTKEPTDVEKLIEECISIKTQIVETDYEEKTGLRRTLNFGHTIGHALEQLEDFHISHGEAVAIGMIVESYLSMKMNILSHSDFLAIEKTIRSFPFLLKIDCETSLEKMHQTLNLDKKALKGEVRFVLLEKIGACHPFNGLYCSQVPQKILDNVLTWMIQTFRART